MKTRVNFERRRHAPFSLEQVSLLAPDDQVEGFDGFDRAERFIELVLERPRSVEDD
jgi:hypothetical protein